MFLGDVKQNIIVLTIANLIIGLIEFVFNLYLSRVFGAEGLGLLSLITPVNNLFSLFMTEGLVVTISKISSRHEHFHDYSAMNRNIKVVTAFSFLWSLVLAALLCLSAKFIAARFLGDSTLMYPILAVCPLMLLMSVSNIIKGHFLGLAKIKIPAAINISEKLFRFPILYLLLRFCLNNTDFPPITLIYLCYAIGEMQSVFFLVLYYKKTMPKVPFPGESLGFKGIKAILHPLIKGAAPICLTQCLLELANAFSGIIVKGRLCSIGYTTSETLTLMGMYKGMVFPLMIYPMIFVGSICSIVVPRVATLIAAEKTASAKKLIRKQSFCVFFCRNSYVRPVLAFADEMGMLFYKRSDLAMMIRLVGACAPLLYVTASSTSLLISVGKEAQSFRNTLFQQLLLLIFLIIFTGMPALNIYGYIAAIALSNGVLLLQNLHTLKFR